MLYRFPIYKYSEETGFRVEEEVLASYDPQYVAPPKQTVAEDA
jgi:hypothetical protein